MAWWIPRTPPLPPSPNFINFLWTRSLPPIHFLLRIRCCVYVEHEQNNKRKYVQTNSNHILKTLLYTIKHIKKGQRHTDMHAGKHTHSHASQHSVQIKLSTLFTNINFPTKPMYVWQPLCGGSPDFSFLPEKFSFISKFSAEFSINFVSAVSITDEEKTIILIRFRCYCFGVFEPNSIPLKFLIKL